MKHTYRLLLFALLFISVCTCLNAQIIDADAEGNSTLFFNGGGVTADVTRARINASYYNATNHAYSKSVPLFGMNISGGHRNRLSGLLDNSNTAFLYKANLSLGIAFMSNFRDKLSSVSKFEENLLADRETLRNDSLIKRRDTSFVFEQIDYLKTNYPAHSDTLKQIYIAHGPSKLTLAKWRTYSLKVSAAEGNSNFENAVDNIIMLLEGSSAISRYSSVVRQLKIIDEELNTVHIPAKYFSQTNLFFDLGLTGTSFNTAAFDVYRSPAPGGGLDSTAKLSVLNSSKLYAALGLNVFSSQKFCLGVKVGAFGTDNFELLTPIRYDSSTTFNSSRSSASNSFTAYQGEYQNNMAAFLSASISYANKISIGHVVLTPLYFTISRRSTVGTSITLITKSGLSMAANVEGLVIREENSLPTSVDRFATYSVGLKVGYLLSDLSFLR